MLLDGPERQTSKYVAQGIGKVVMFKTILYVVKSRLRYQLGYAMVGTIVLLSILAPVFATHDPVSADFMAVLLPPDASHFLGTDVVGMDIYSRVLFAPRIDIMIAVFGTAFSSLIGISLGMWVGYNANSTSYKGKVAYAVMRAADVLQAFPVFVFAIALVAALGPSVETVVVAITFVNAPIYLRLMRGQAMSIRRTRYVEAAQMAGLSPWRIMLKHVLPNAAGPALAQMSINVGWSVLLAAGLSFIGAGVRPPTPELGSMIASGFQSVATGQWWPSVVPGVVLALIVLGFSLIGESFEVGTDSGKMRTLLASEKRKRLAGADLSK